MNNNEEGKERVNEVNNLHVVKESSGGRLREKKDENKPTGE